MDNSYARNILQEFRKYSYRKDEPNAKLYNRFINKRMMFKICHTIQNYCQNVFSLFKRQNKSSGKTIFDFSGFSNDFTNDSVDDFELISMFIIERQR